MFKGTLFSLLVGSVACGGLIAPEPSRSDDPGTRPPIEANDETLPPATEPTPRRICGAALSADDCTSEQVQRYRSETADGLEVLVVGNYEAADARGATGHATVIDTRTAAHVLLVTGYEATEWTIEKAEGSGLTAVYRTGYETQTIVAPADVTVSPTQRRSCGYSWPYDGQGCDTHDVLADAESFSGHPVDQLVGCYASSHFTVKDDVECTSDEGPSSEWQQFDFERDPATSACPNGVRYATYSSEYRRWIGAETCTPDSYKLYLAFNKYTFFMPIVDGAGFGQDHCELVNPAFELPNEDEITSGGCTECSIEPWRIGEVGSGSVFARDTLGQPFEPQREWPAQSYTASLYRCGVSIP